MDTWPAKHGIIRVTKPEGRMDYNPFITLFRSDVLHVKFFRLAADKVARPPDVPVDVAAVRALDVVVGVPAFGHDPVRADAAASPREPVFYEEVPVDARAVLTDVVVGSGAVGEPAVSAAHFRHLVHPVAAVAFALKLEQDLMITLHRVGLFTIAGTSVASALVWPSASD